MLIAITKNTLVDPTSVSAIEQIEDKVYVHINGRMLMADGFPQDLMDFLNKDKDEHKDFWAGR